MKTNHQRNFKDKLSSRAVYGDYIAFYQVIKSPLSGKAISASANSGDHANGKRGIAYDVKGAKKFVKSRTRFHENQALKKIVNEQ